ncbi:MAG: 50S ribosomal protein L24 [bacterium]|nr:50S ribosomal protein L24 [bacterium]
MSIKKGDNVKILAGKDRGKTGKIIKVLPKRGRVVVEGLQMVKKHIRPKKEGEKGQVVEIPASIHISNVKQV